ncbi:MAG: hypothetical protein AB8G26_19800 [Ilumatobacter sp.]
MWEPEPVFPMAPEDDLFTDGGGLPLEAVVVASVFLGVFVVGLRAIKRQRDQGRRSKLPPIG